MYNLCDIFLIKQETLRCLSSVFMTKHDTDKLNPFMEVLFVHLILHQRNKVVCHAVILIKGDTLVGVDCSSDITIAQGLLVVGGMYAVCTFTRWA